MRILQINSVCEKGSTGSICLDIAECLISKGHECRVMYGYGKCNSPYACRFGFRLENLFHNIFFTRLLGLHGYGSILGTLQLLKRISRYRPDVVHIHNLHVSYVNLVMLWRYLAKHDIPVLVTLHDCFSFTGKCSHFTAAGCSKWKSECGHCPVYNLPSTNAPSLIFDNSRQLFLKNKRLYSQIRRMTVVAVSDWLEAQARQSILAGPGHRICRIYNWVDTDKFHRMDSSSQQEFRRIYGLGEDTKYLLSVSSYWDHAASRFKDAVRLADALPQGWRLVMVGRPTRGTKMPEKAIHIPYLGGPEALSTAYSVASGYVHLSVEDTFGKVMAEAMACGVPVISFDSTACAEVPAGFGIVVPPHDIGAIVESLPLVAQKAKRGGEMVEYVRANYGREANISQYIVEYQRLLEPDEKKVW